MARAPSSVLGAAAAAVLVLAATSVSSAASQEKCRTGCKGIVPKDFKFAEGTTYKYNYEGVVDISLSSAEAQQTTTKVHATVLLTQHGQCEQTIQVQNLEILGADAKKYSDIQNVDKPIRINFHDGHVEDIICTEPSDTTNSLNIKRAIASLFQAAHKHGTETDVFGVCPTDFSTHKEGATLVIKKKRNLNKCSFRESIRQDFIATAFNLDSEIKSSPFLQGDFTSEQRLKNGILDVVVVNENYLYVPFSAGDSGAKVRVHTTLTLTGTSKTGTRASCGFPRTIIFDNPNPVATAKTNVNTILAAVKAVAQNVDVVVKEKSAAKLYNLIRIFKLARRNDLLAVYNQVRAGAGFRDKVTAKRIFLDALFRAGNGESIEAALELYKNKEFDELESKLFFLGLSFSRYVTANSLKEATGILDVQDLPREAYLGIGTLIGRFCKSNTCKDVPQLKLLLAGLLKKLNVKVTDRKVENSVISILKAIGNAGYVSDEIAAKIVHTAQDKSVPTRLRVAALEAYLSTPCRDKFRDSALNILKDVQQDSEIRIKAYLAAAECPNGKVATAVKNLLNDEPSYQVGSFISSHLRTLRNSVNPDKASARAQLGNIIVVKKYPFDFRKYSFNVEASNVFDALGVGNSVEANVIYSQNSFLPRSTSLNLTTEVFGHVFNFLQVDTRQENLDKLLEYYVGPLGVLRTKSGKEIVNYASDKFQELYTSAVRTLDAHRDKRDVSKANIDFIKKQLARKENELNKDLELDLSVKLFGSEALFLSLNDNSEKYSLQSIIDEVFDVIGKQIDNAKNFDRTIQSNLKFLDADVAYPTSVGFPLRLSLDGTAVVQIKTSGKINIPKIVSEPDKALEFTLIPSADIEIVARLSLDAALIETGLKVTANLYTATGGSLDVSFRDSELVTDIKYSLPVDKQHVVRLSNEIVFETREVGCVEEDKPIKFSQAKVLTVCVDQLNPFLGLTFCADVNTPNLEVQKGAAVLPFPLSGNAKFNVYFNKEDLSHFHYRSKGYEGDKFGLEVSLDAIDVHQKPKATAKLELFVRPELSAKFTLSSGSKTSIAEARVTNNDKEIAAFVKVGSLDFIYYGKIGLEVSGSSQKHVYKPILEYKAGTSELQKPPYYLDGEVIVEQGRDGTKYTLHNLKAVSPQKTISLIGSIKLATGDVAADITLNDGSNSGKFTAELIFSGNNIKVGASLDNSINPGANFDLKFNYDGSNGFSYTSDFHLGHGKANVLRISEAVSFADKNGHNFVKFEVGYPALGLATKFKVEAKPKVFEWETKVAYKELKIESDLELTYDKKSEGDYDLEFSYKGLDYNLVLDASRVIDGKRSKVANKVVFNDKTWEANGIVNHNIDKNKFDVGTDLVVKATGCPDSKLVSKLNYGVLDVELILKLTSGGTSLVDVAFKGNEALNANGHLKLNLKSSLIANGQITANKGTGKANILLEFVKADRKIKGETSFVISDPTYNLDLTLYTNFEKDNKKKYHLSTKNNIKDDVIESKNHLEGLQHKLTANFKLGSTGSFTEGTIFGDFEVELPSQHYFVGKLNRESHDTKGFIDAQIESSYEFRPNKNAKGYKLTHKGVVKNTNFDKGQMDLHVDVVLDLVGKTLVVDGIIKAATQGVKESREATVKVSGSLLPEVAEASLKSNADEDQFDYSAHSSYGNVAHLNVDGKLKIPSKGASKEPGTASINVEIKTPNSKVRTIKFNADGSVSSQKNKEEILELTGSTGLYIDDDGTEKDATLDMKLNTEVKIGYQNGHIKSTFNLQKQDPIIVTVGYQEQESKGRSKYTGNAAVQYKNDKIVKGDLIFNRALNELDFDLNIETPVETAKNIRFLSHGTRTDNGKTFTGKTTIQVNEKKYTFSQVVSISELTPSFSYELGYPDGKVDKFVGAVKNIGERSFAGDLKVVYTRWDFTLDSSVNINAEDLDNVILKLSLDSPALKVEKFQLNANSKDAKGTKKIQFSAKASDKNILSGMTTYKVREEHEKFVIEGSGNFKVKDESKAGNFKFTRKGYTTDKDQEQGVEVTFDAALGLKAIDLEFKATNKQFRLANSYCEEKQQCAQIELDFKTDIISIDEFENNLIINVDLKKLSIPYEYGLKAITKHHGMTTEHTMDVHFQINHKKYQYTFYVRPKNFGFTFTTPKRIFALEGKLDTKWDNKDRELDLDVALYFNKKVDPRKKTTLNLIWKQHSEALLAAKTSLEGRFSYPGCRKDLTISYADEYDLDDVGHFMFNYKLVLDVIPDIREKIISEWRHVSNKENDEVQAYLDLQPFKFKISGKELVHASTTSVNFDLKIVTTVNGKDSHCIVYADVKENQVKMTLQLRDVLIADLSQTSQFEKDLIVVKTKYKGLGLEPLVGNLEIKNLNTLKFTLNKQSNPDRKILVNSGLIPDQIADFRVEFSEGGKKTDLVHASVKLDNVNFLKSDYAVSNDNLKKLLFEPIRRTSSEVGKKTNEAVEKYLEQVKNDIRVLGENAKHLPSFKPITDYYEREYRDISEEVKNDEVLKQVTESWGAIFSATYKTSSELLNSINTILEKILNSVQVQFKQVAESVEKDIVPSLKKLIDSISVESIRVYEAISEAFFTILGSITEFIDRHHEEFKTVASSLSKVNQDFVRFFVKTGEQIKAVFVTETQKLYEELKALPVYEKLKNAYNNLLSSLPNTEVIIEYIRNAAATIKDVATVPQVHKVVDLIVVYAEKKLSDKPVDDLDELSKIFKASTVAVDKIIEQAGTTGTDSSFNIPIVTKFWYTIPKFVVTKSSFLNQLLRGDFPSIENTIFSLSFNPRLWLIPTRFFALVVQGQHIFSFDGKHLTFPGNCNYLLARDALHGNFTVAGTYLSGQLTAITISDQTDMITIKKGCQSSVNGAGTEFPIRRKHITALRETWGFRVILDAGVKVECDSELTVCSVDISGFYHGRIRGLLGNANYEKFDDLILPNGKIVKSESEFGNSYKMMASCKPATCPDHSTHHPVESCKKLFSSEAEWSYCYPFVNVANFRQACEHGVQGGVAGTEKALATAFAVECWNKFVPVEIPSKYIKCDNSGEEIDVGTSFSVKLPQNSADIVIAVDVVTTNEKIYKQLVFSIVQNLNHELSARGITDVEYHLLVYGGDIVKTAYHVTTNGGKLRYKGKLPNVKFSEIPEDDDIELSFEPANVLLATLRQLKADIDLAIGATAQAQAFYKAISFPFRPKAVRTIIAVTGEICESGSLFLLQYLRANLIYDESVILQTITTMEDAEFKVKDDKTTKSVIGFNKHGVITFSECRKTPRGRPELLKELSYDDYCSEFTVATGGNVFVTDNFLHAKDPNKKLFAQTAAYNIAESITAVEQVLDCTCEHEFNIGVQNSCEVKSRKDKPPSGRKIIMRG